MGSITNPRSFLQVMTQAPTIKGKIFKPPLAKDHALISTNDIKSLIDLNSNANTNNKDPFYVLDLGVVATLMDRWAHSLPDFLPFYAVKCNPHPDLLATMAALGSNFDCTTRAEIESVLTLGVSPDRIVDFANPCKLEFHIDYRHQIKYLNPRSEKHVNYHAFFLRSNSTQFILFPICSPSNCCI